MNNEHTPGPWKALPTDHADNELWICAAPDEKGQARLVAVCASGNPSHKTDAALIAAAPDLLEALRAFAEFCDAGDLSEEYGAANFTITFASLRRAKAAINKATQV